MKIELSKSYMLVTCRKGTVSPCLSFLDELEQFRGNKCEWLSQAKKLVAIHRKVHWDKILSENSEWGPPIPDGGYNKETLFKQAAPKYSKLFANANDKQSMKYIFLLNRIF